ncbi:MAG: Rab family GTPase [Cyanobacteria bacterium J06639_1]
MTVLSKKICLIGDNGVGKTSLIRRFVERQFSDEYLSTVGVKISRKTLYSEIAGNGDRELRLLIWDLEGRQKFKAISPTYLRGASGAVIVADVTREETIASLIGHIRMFLTVNPSGIVAIAYNKIDLRKDPKDETLSASLLQTIHQDRAGRSIDAYLTSAKSGLHVDRLFQKLGDSILAAG